MLSYAFLWSVTEVRRLSNRWKTDFEILFTYIAYVALSSAFRTTKGKKVTSIYVAYHLADNQEMLSTTRDVRGDDLVAFIY